MGGSRGRTEVVTLLPCPSSAGVRIDLTKRKGTGGVGSDFSGGFHGAGSGGAEAVGPVKTGLEKAGRMTANSASPLQAGIPVVGPPAATVLGGLLQSTAAARHPSRIESLLCALCFVYCVPCGSPSWKEMAQLG